MGEGELRGLFKWKTSDPTEIVARWREKERERETTTEFSHNKVSSPTALVVRDARVIPRFLRRPPRLVILPPLLPRLFFTYPDRRDG